MKNNTLLQSLILLLFTIYTPHIFGQKKSKDIFQIARSGSLKELKILVENNPNSIDKVNDAGYTALTLACYNGNNDVAKFLADRASDIDANSGYGTALMAATIKGNEDLVDYLIARNADANITDNNGTTALHYAVMFDMENIVMLLLKGKAKYNLKDSRGNTAKDYANLKKNIKIQKLLTQ